MPTVAAPPVSADRLLALLDDARRAPSVLNTQPWRFRVADGTVDVRADRARGLPGLDPDGRELALSCGAAVAALRIAAAHAGLAATVDLVPDAADGDLLARVSFAPGPRPLDDRRLRALRARRTHRGALADRPVDAATLAAVARAAGRDVWLATLTTDAEKAPVAALVAEAADALGEHATKLADVRAWLRPHGDPRPDGVRDADQGPGDWRASARTTADAVGHHKAAALAAAPAVLVLGTDADSLHDWLRAGMALEDLLVEAADRGLAVSYANEPVEMGGAFRRRLAALAGGRCPQVVLRLGAPADDGDRRRRPLRDVVEGG